MSGHQMESCVHCGALINPNTDCPYCREAEVEEEVEAAQKTLGRKTRTPPAVLMLDEQIKAIRRRQKDLIEELRETLSLIAEKPEPKQLEGLQRVRDRLSADQARLASAAAKLVREWLAYQRDKHKIAVQMTPEEQIAQVIRWFDKMGKDRQIVLLQALSRTYNERAVKREGRRPPWKKKSSASE